MIDCADTDQDALEVANPAFDIHQHGVFTIGSPIRQRYCYRWWKILIAPAKFLVCTSIGSQLMMCLDIFVDLHACGEMSVRITSTRHKERVQRQSLTCWIRLWLYGQNSFTRGTNNGMKVSLALAMSKVAPLKPISIPRMELQIAVLGVCLSKIITSTDRIKPK